MPTRSEGMRTTLEGMYSFRAERSSQQVFYLRKYDSLRRAGCAYPPGGVRIPSELSVRAGVFRPTSQGEQLPYQRVLPKAELIVIRDLPAGALHDLSHQLVEHGVVCEHPGGNGADHPPAVTKPLVAGTVVVDLGFGAMPEIAVVLKDDAPLRPAEVHREVGLSQRSLKGGRYLHATIEGGSGQAAPTKLNGKRKEKNHDRLHGRARAVDDERKGLSHATGTVPVIGRKMLDELSGRRQRRPLVETPRRPRRPGVAAAHLHAHRSGTSEARPRRHLLQTEAGRGYENLIRKLVESTLRKVRRPDVAT